MSLRLDTEIASDGGGARELLLYNWQSSAYERIYLKALETYDEQIMDVLTANPTRYVNAATGQIKGKVVFYLPFNASRTWSVRVDQVALAVTIP